jgi:hypothetical protein
MRAKSLLVAFAAVTLLVTATAPAQAVEAEAEAGTASPNALGRKQDFWKLGLGARGNYVTTSGFDAFAKNNFLPQWTLEADKTLLVFRRFSVSAGVAWDVGARGDKGVARGAEASLLVNRFSVPIEAHYHLAPWLYAFGRVAPGVALAHASVKDASSNADLTGSGAAFTTDLSAGASFLLGPHVRPEKRLARLWVSPEFGYALATAASLDLTPAQDENDTRPVGTTKLGAIALSGPFFRVSVALTF